MAANTVALSTQRLLNSAATVGTVIVFTDLDHQFTQCLTFQVLLLARHFRVMIVTVTTYTQGLAHQPDRIGILLLGDKRVFHFVSAAKVSRPEYFNPSRSQKRT
jgi:uncharacterized SAM-binding protein YcdF (DUF218 family)